MARLSDSAIVRLFDEADFSGDLYLISGSTFAGPSLLREMIRAGYRRRPLLELAHLMGGICQGLSAAHRAGVIHRDLKPSNLLLALDGAERTAFAASKELPKSLANAQVKIADFGIAKALADSGTTLTNAFSGTPGYMAPEQFRGLAPTPETDVYTLGAITCELLTGKLPPQPLRTIEGVHPAVTEVVSKAMSQAREARFPSAAAFYEALCEGDRERDSRRIRVRSVRRRRVWAESSVCYWPWHLLGFIVIIVILSALLKQPRRPVQAHLDPFPRENPVSPSNGIRRPASPSSPPGRGSRSREGCRAKGLTGPGRGDESNGLSIFRSPRD